MEANGKIESCEIAKRKDGTEITGTKKDGTPYTNYKYKISGRYYSGFESLKDFDVELGNQVIVNYKEEPNPNNADKPYKNIINITRAKDKEADEQYHVKDVGTPDEPKNIPEETVEPKAEPKNIEEKVNPSEAPDWDKINAEKQVRIKANQDLIQERIRNGMVFNKTVDWIISTRKLALEGKLRDKENKVRPAYDYPLEENFDTVFDFLMSKAK